MALARTQTPARCASEMFSHHQDLPILEIVEIQLRDYRIKPGHMDDWITAWERGVLPLRRQEGFEVVGAWVDRAHDRFVWLVKYSRADGFRAAEERYHARPERLSLHPEPSEFIQSATLDMVDGVL